MAKPPIAIAHFAHPAQIPAQARALFGQTPYDTQAWYETTLATALPPDATACFYVATHSTKPAAIFPMLAHAKSRASLTTPYSCLWQPLWAPGLSDGQIETIAKTIASHWKNALVTLEALDQSAIWLTPFLRGIARAGFVPLRYNHFGNWYLPTATLTWSAYLAGRSGSLRSMISRANKRLITKMGAEFSLITGGHGLCQAITDYEAIYAASWKQPEPYPHFNAALMQACAQAGTLRLALLHLQGKPIAAQFWILQNGWAGVQKLAHDEAYKHLAPGTVLSALITQHLLDIDHATELDYGRGDDAYKKLWVDQRRQRIGILLARPTRLRGMAEIAKHYVGQLRRKWHL